MQNLVCNRSCKIVNEGSTLRIFCPYNLNTFGLETNRNCREKIFPMISDNTLTITIENGLVTKTYRKNIKELFDYISLINDHFNKFSIKNYTKDELIYDPSLLRSSYTPNDLMSTWAYKNSTFFKYLVNYFAMNYSDHEIYEWLFEPYVDYSDNFKSIIASKRVNVYDVGAGFVSLYNHSDHCFYIVEELTKKYNTQESLEKTLWMIVTKSDNLSKIMVPLYDENVQEIYLDGEDKFVYLDHEEYGRCSTNIYLTHPDIERLRTYSSIIGKSDINLSVPSLKIDLTLNGIPHRFSLDAPPLTLSTSINIRNLIVRYANPQRLIKTGTITAEAMAYLIFLATNRLNIIICGEPNSGKTTLANAIDSELPSIWRRVYIEDTIESLNFKNDNFHQIKIQTTPLEQGSRVFKKSMEIVKLLHRSPDWIYLGEIEGLIYRWTKHYKIDPSSIKLVNTIVLMERDIEPSGKIIRQVKSIIEFDENGNPITIYNRINGKLIRTINSLFDSQNIKYLIINGKQYDDLKNLFFKILNKINGGMLDEKIYE